MSSPELDAATVPTTLRVTPDGDQVTGRCECCGQISRRVSGTIETTDAAVAAFTVWWTVGHIAEHGAEFDLICGRWGDGIAQQDARLAELFAPAPCGHCDAGTRRRQPASRRSRSGARRGRTI